MRVADELSQGKGLDKFASEHLLVWMRPSKPGISRSSRRSTPPISRSICRDAPKRALARRVAKRPGLARLRAITQDQEDAVFRPARRAFRRMESSALNLRRSPSGSSPRWPWRFWGSPCSSWPGSSPRRTTRSSPARSAGICCSSPSRPAILAAGRSFLGGATDHPPPAPAARDDVRDGTDGRAPGGFPTTGGGSQVRQIEDTFRADRFAGRVAARPGTLLRRGRRRGGDGGGRPRP